MNFPDKPWRPGDWPPLGPSYGQSSWNDIWNNWSRPQYFIEFPTEKAESGWKETLMMVALIIFVAIVIGVSR